MNPPVRRQDLLGAWDLVSLSAVSDAGQVYEPYGTAPAGLLTYTDDGSMSAMLMRRDRRPFASGDLAGGTTSEVEEAFAGFDAYCGTFTLDGGAVTHHVRAARFPNWVGSDQVRQVTLRDDELWLDAPIYAMGTNWVVRAAWKRRR